jgi:hypothetical protein
MVISNTPNLGCYTWDISSLVTQMTQVRAEVDICQHTSYRHYQGVKGTHGAFIHSSLSDHLATTLSKVVAAMIAVNSRSKCLL